VTANRLFVLGIFSFGLEVFIGEVFGILLNKFSSLTDQE
jgi:hypothetical protein